MRLKINTTERKALVTLLCLVTIIMAFNISKFVAPVSLIWGGSSFLHLSIINSIANGFYPWQDAHYIGEIAYYPWFQHLIIALIFKVTHIPVGYIFNFWPIFQVLSLMTAYFWLGKTIKGERTGLLFAVLILLPRSTLRAALMPWPLYSSYILVPLFLGAVYISFTSCKRRYMVLSGTILGIALLTHIFTFLMLSAFVAFYFILFVLKAGYTRSDKETRTAVYGCAVILLVGAVVSSIFWFPLYSKYGTTPKNPTQEDVYKFKVYKDSYPFAKDRNDIPLILEDLVLNKIVSKVEGGEQSADFNNILLFSLVITSLILISERNQNGILNDRRLLVLAFLLAAFFMRFHEFFRFIITTQFQPIRFMDFIEHSFVLVAGLGLSTLKKKNLYALVGILAVFALISFELNYYYNPNAVVSRTPLFGTISKDPEFTVVPDRDAKYAFLAETANELNKLDSGVILAHPISALYLAGLTGRKYVALPQGFSNVFVDVDERVNDSKRALNSRDIEDTIEVLNKYKVRYVVVDPFAENPEKFKNNKHFEKIYEIEDVDYPNPWKKLIGNVTIYRYHRYQ